MKGNSSSLESVDCVTVKTNVKWRQSSLKLKQRTQPPQIPTYLQGTEHGMSKSRFRVHQA